MTATPRHARRSFRPDLMMVALVALGLLAGNMWCGTAFGQASLTPLVTFGSNGWLAPGSNPYLSTLNNERGFGWNPVTKNVVLPSRNGGNFVAILNGTTGVVTGTLNTSGVSGGTLAMMGAGVSDDGAIYVPNLQATSSALSPFKVYGWSGETDVNPPTVVFSQVNPPASSGAFRFGDSFAVTGSGASAKFAVAGSSSGTTAGLPNNGNFMIGSVDGSNTNTIYNAIPGTQTASNDYRLGLTFVNSGTLIGNQGTSAKITGFGPATTLSGTGATISGSIALGAADRPLDYTVLDGKGLLAVVNTNSSVISVYDITNPAAATLLATGSTVVGTLTANGNATGGLQWGEVLSPTSQILYAMSTNQGLQAMVFAVPEPSTYAMLGGASAAIGLIAARKRRREV